MNNEFVHVAAGCVSHSKKAPLLLFIRPLKKCNARCKMCSFWKSPAEEIPFAKMREIIKTASSLGTREIRLSGGEPMLYPKFFETLSFIRKNGMDCSFITNGFLLNSKNIGKILKISPKQINISLDFSIAGEHDSQRGFPGLWEKALDGAKILSAKRTGKNPKIVMNFVISNKNFIMLPSMVDLCEGAFDEINLIPVRNLASWALSEKQIVFFNKKIVPIFRDKLERKKVSLRSENPFIFGTEKKEISESARQNYSFEFYKKNKCFASQFMLFIDSNGSVFPCSNTPYNRDFEIGNVFENSLSEIWGNGFSKTCSLAGKSKTCFACEPTSIFFNSKLNREFG